MKTRYDLYEQSKYKDIDGESFPDPLSINYNEFNMTNPAIFKKISYNGHRRFWLEYYMYYNFSDYFDILLTLNNLDYIENFNQGDGMFFPDSADIFNFTKKYE